MLICFSLSFSGLLLLFLHPDLLFSPDLPLIFSFVLIALWCSPSMMTLDSWLLIKGLHLLPQLYFNSLSWLFPTHNSLISRSLISLTWLFHSLPSAAPCSPEFWPLASGESLLPTSTDKLTAWQQKLRGITNCSEAIVNESSPCCNQALSVFTLLNISLIHSEAGDTLDLQPQHASKGQRSLTLFDRCATFLYFLLSFIKTGKMGHSFQGTECSSVVTLCISLLCEWKWAYRVYSR